jgi:hypothetical protein
VYYVKRNFRGKKPYTNKKFNEVMHLIGMEQFKVKKESLMLGQSKYPGEAESKITIARLLTPEELETALATHFRLLTVDIKDAED